MKGWRGAPVVLWIGLLLLAAACQGQPRVEQEGEAEVEAAEGEAGHGEAGHGEAAAAEAGHAEYVPLAQRGGPLFHPSGELHATGDFKLAYELALVAEPPATYVPLAARESTLIHGLQEQHTVSTITLAVEQATGLAAAGGPGPRLALPGAAPGRPPASPAALQINLAGTLGRREAGRLTVLVGGVPRQVLVGEGTQLRQEGAGSLADLQPGQFVAVVASPEYRASAIMVHPAGLPTPRPGKWLLGGELQGKVATFGTVTAVREPTLTVSAVGQTFLFGVGSGVEVRRAVPAGVDDLAIGRTASVSGALRPDGTMAASLIYLPGPRLPLLE